MRVIAADGEHAPAADEIEIARAGGVPEMRALAAHEARVEADGLQHPHHLMVEMAGVQVVAVGFASVEQRAHVGHELVLSDSGGERFAQPLPHALDADRRRSGIDAARDGQRRVEPAGAVAVVEPTHEAAREGEHGEREDGVDREGAAGEGGHGSRTAESLKAPTSSWPDLSLIPASARVIANRDAALPGSVSERLGSLSDVDIRDKPGHEGLRLCMFGPQNWK